MFSELISKVKVEQDSDSQWRLEAVSKVDI